MKKYFISAVLSSALFIVGCGGGSSSNSSSDEIVTGDNNISENIESFSNYSKVIDGPIADAHVVVNKISSNGIYKIFDTYTTSGDTLEEIGNFKLPNFEDGNLYQITSENGCDWDVNDDGIKDESCTPFNANLYLLLPFKVNVANVTPLSTLVSELVYYYANVDKNHQYLDSYNLRNMIQDYNLETLNKAFNAMSLLASTILKMPASYQYYNSVINFNPEKNMNDIKNKVLWSNILAHIKSNETPREIGEFISNWVNALPNVDFDKVDNDTLKELFSNTWYYLDENGNKNLVWFENGVAKFEYENETEEESIKLVSNNTMITVENSDGINYLTLIEVEKNVNGCDYYFVLDGGLDGDVCLHKY
jgi:hypothetical protein